MENILSFMKMRAEALVDNVIAATTADIEPNEPIREQDQEDNSTE